MTKSLATAIASDPEKFRAAIELIKNRLRSHLRGQEQVIEMSLSAFFAQGHLLLEGPPGTGKTSLAKAMATALGGSFKRIQMTSDLLPSDIVGILRLIPGTSEFEFRKGPVFTNFLLTDELNRTSAKTQSALLEAMAEKTTTVDGRTYPLPSPFFVVATQNPFEFQGVQPLAESQLDRFIFHLQLSPPDKKAELEIYQKGFNTAINEDDETPLIDSSQLKTFFEKVDQVFIEPSLLEYLSDLIIATRNRPEVVYGVSVRGGLQMIAAVKSLAFVRGRDFVTPKDISDAAVPALAHRLCFASGEVTSHFRAEIILDILSKLKTPS